MYNNELMHHGILGMKWGVRRYQNKDGTLTIEGKRRTNSEGNNQSKPKRNTSSRKTNISNDKEPIKKMSDSELRERISRLELEKRYKDLMKSNEQVKVHKGKAFVMDVLEKSGKNIATQAVAYFMGTALNSALKKDIVDPKNIQKKK